MRKGDLVYIYLHGKAGPWFFDDRDRSYPGSVLVPLINCALTEGGMEMDRLEFHLPREYAS